MAAVAASVFLTACGGADLNETERVAPLEASVESNPKKSTTKSSNEPIDPGGLEAPPPVTLHFLDQSIDLHAWTYCYRDGCVDGAPPPDPPNVGDPDEVVVEFPLPESSFKVSFSPAGEKCGRVQTVPLEVTDDGNFLLRPVGFAGTYDVTLFGGGNGDLFTTFRWTTPTDGPLPEPKARLAVLANQDPGVGSYGVELEVTNLAHKPRTSSATITVESSDGEALTSRPNQLVATVSRRAPCTGTARTTRVWPQGPWATGPSGTRSSSC